MKNNSFVMLAEGSYIADELFETASYYIVHHILFFMLQIYISYVCAIYSH